MSQFYGLAKGGAIGGSPPLFSLESDRKVKVPLQRAFFRDLAEREGFEPPVRFRTTDFESAAIDHSATSPVVNSKGSILPALVSLPYSLPPLPPLRIPSWT